MTVESMANLCERGNLRITSYAGICVPFLSIHRIISILSYLSTDYVIVISLEMLVEHLLLPGILLDT